MSGANSSESLAGCRPRALTAFALVCIRLASAVRPGNERACARIVCSICGDDDLVLLAAGDIVALDPDVILLADGFSLGDDLL